MFYCFLLFPISWNILISSNLYYQYFFHVPCLCWSIEKLSPSSRSFLFFQHYLLEFFIVLYFMCDPFLVNFLWRIYMTCDLCLGCFSFSFSYLLPFFFLLSSSSFLFLLLTCRRLVVPTPFVETVLCHIQIPIHVIFILIGLIVLCHIAQAGCTSSVSWVLGLQAFLPSLQHVFSVLYCLCYSDNYLCWLSSWLSVHWSISGFSIFLCWSFYRFIHLSHDVLIICENSKFWN